MADENENLILVQKYLGRRNDFLLIKATWEWGKEAMDMSPLPPCSCLFPIVYKIFFEPGFSKLKPFMQFITHSLSASQLTRFSVPLKKNPRACPYTQILWGQDGPFFFFLFPPLLFWYKPSHMRLFLCLIIFPFMLCESLHWDIRIKMLRAATVRSCALSTFEKDPFTGHLLWTSDGIGWRGKLSQFKISWSFSSCGLSKC